MKRLLIVILLLFCEFSLFAQQRYIFINGNIASSENLSPVSYAHIISKLSLFGAVSDAEGNFRIPVYPIDTLQMICVGFVKCDISIDLEKLQKDTLFVVMQKDTIMLNEVIVKPFPDYETFKKLIVNMPTQMPMILPGVNDNVKISRFYQPPSKLPPPSGGPAQLIYNAFNDKAVRDRRLLRNRRKMNKILIKEGKGDSLMPLQLDFRR